jgi:hypothetical protein
MFLLPNPPLTRIGSRQNHHPTYQIFMKTSKQKLQEILSEALEDYQYWLSQTGANVSALGKSQQCLRLIQQLEADLAA